MKNYDDIGKLILRTGVAAMILVHGISKITNPGQVDFIIELLTTVGLPGFIAYGVYIGEILAPIAMIIGYRTKIAAAILTATMVVVILLGHQTEIFPLSDFVYWGIELQLSFLLGALAVSFLGAGKIALSSKDKFD